MRGRRLSDNYASLIFKYFDENMLNPLEKVWGKTKKHLALDPPKTPEEAAQKIRDIGLNLPKNYAQNLALSIFRRIQNVIA